MKYQAADRGWGKTLLLPERADVDYCANPIAPAAVLQNFVGSRCECFGLCLVSAQAQELRIVGEDGCIHRMLRAQTSLRNVETAPQSLAGLLAMTGARRQRCQII